MVIRTFPDTYESFQCSDLATGHCALDFMKVSVVAEKAAKRWSPDAREQENCTYTRVREGKGIRSKEERERESEKETARWKRTARTNCWSGGAGGTAAPAQIRCLRRRFAAWTPRPRSRLVEMVEDTRSASPRPIYIRRADRRKWEVTPNEDDALCQPCELRSTLNFPRLCIDFDRSKKMLCIHITWYHASFLVISFRMLCGYNYGDYIFL